MAKFDQGRFRFSVGKRVLCSLVCGLAFVPISLSSAHEKPPSLEPDSSYRYGISCDVSIDIKERIATVKTLNYGSDYCFSWNDETEKVLSHVSSLGPITDLKMFQWGGFIQCCDILEQPNIRDHLRSLSVKLFGDQKWDACPKLEKLKSLKIERYWLSANGEPEEVSKCVSVILGNSPGVRSLTFVGIDLSQLDLVGVVKKFRIKKLLIRNCEISNDTLSAFAETGLETLEVELNEPEPEHVDAIRKLVLAEKLKMITLRWAGSANKDGVRRSRIISSGSHPDVVSIRTRNFTAAFENTRSPERIVGLALTDDDLIHSSDEGDRPTLNVMDLKRFSQLSRLSLYDLSFNTEVKDVSRVFPKVRELEIRQVTHSAECIEFFLSSGSLKKLTLEEEDGLRILKEVDWPESAKKTLHVRLLSWYEEDENLPPAQLIQILSASQSIKVLSLRIDSIDYQLLQDLLNPQGAETDTKQ